MRSSSFYIKYRKFSFQQTFFSGFNILYFRFIFQLSKQIIQNFTNLKQPSMPSFKKIIDNNRKWSQTKLSQDKQYFKKHQQSQSPQYLWIGCSDSRIPAETILNLQPGEIFVHRNIANQVSLSDINTLSVIQYAVQVLKVKDIIVTGHYGCGGIRAACKKHDHGALQTWLSNIRELRIRFSKLLNKSQQQNQNTLVELNVKAQVYDIAKIPCVQKAWLNEQQLRIHGLVYRLDNGLLKDLGLTLSKIQQIPEQFWIYQKDKVAQVKQKGKQLKPKQKVQSSNGLLYTMFGLATVTMGAKVLKDFFS